MWADPVFRVVSMVLGMAILGLAWYSVKVKWLRERESSESQAEAASQKNQDKLIAPIKKEAAQAAVVFAVVYMVIVLGVSAYT